jgi:hypothetical protein
MVKGKGKAKWPGLEDGDILPWDKGIHFLIFFLTIMTNGHNINP